MTSIDDNEIRPLSHDELELVNGGGFLPIPPIHGGPVHIPVFGPDMRTPGGSGIFPVPTSGPLL